MRDHLRDLFAKEEASAILSDHKLVDILRSKGVDIARRTVAKYRSSMGIPSSIQRRRAKRLESLINS